MSEEDQNRMYDEPAKTAVMIVCAIVITIASLSLIAGCSVLERKDTVLPGPDGVVGTADDVVVTEDSDAEGAADSLAAILSLLGFGAIGAGLGAVAEGASTIATNIAKRRRENG